MIVRLSKALLVLQVGLFSLLVGVDNIIDYGTNYAFVEHVLGMDTIFPDSTLKWRAITNPVLEHAAYAVIIALELATGALCSLGAMRLWSAREATAHDFNAAKDMAVAGLVCGIGLWFFGFMTVGGEWFQMWQSKVWNGQEAAFRFIACLGLVLIFLNQRDGELA
jgi:predicted small integral membrane protein